jgi:transcriptional regulator with XRE-family HTH domain
MQPNDDSTPTARFAARVAEAAQASGYDLTPRAGGRAALARASGMSETTITRMLNGERLPDPKFFAPLAKVIGLNPLELLVDAGVIPAEIISADTLWSLSETQPSPVRSSPITPEEAAEQLGINDPYGREMFLGVVERLRREDSAESPDNGQAGGMAAEN